MSVFICIPASSLAVLVASMVLPSRILQVTLLASLLVRLSTCSKEVFTAECHTMITDVSKNVSCNWFNAASFGK